MVRLGLQTRIRPIHARRTGFSLVEMSVVVLIVSIVAVMGLEMTAGFMDRTAYKVTQQRLEAIDKAIVEFRRVNNRVPCPSYHAIDQSHACYGKENNGTGGHLACNNNIGTCADSTIGSAYMGHVPVRDLGLPLSHMVDGYGNRIWYFPTIYHAYNPAVNGNNFTNQPDAIPVRSGKIDANCGGGSDLCQSRGNASYFLFSVGRDKRGGVPPSYIPPTSSYPHPVAPVSCISGAADDGKIDAANCRFDSTTSLMKNGATPVTVPLGVFYDSRFNNGTQESTFFDDIVRWRTKSQL